MASTIFKLDLGEDIEVSGKIVKIDRYAYRNHHKGNSLCWGRMVLIQADNGELVQWFGDSTTEIWRNTFSSKYAATPLVEGDAVTVTGRIHEQRPTDQHFGNRTIVHCPSFTPLED